MRLAFLADIHGNLPALDAVLADVRRWAPDGVYLVGDLVNRCPWNPEVMAWWEAHPHPCVRGNHDWVVGVIDTPENVPPFDDPELFPGLWWTHAQLKEDQRTALRTLPIQLCLTFPAAPPIRLFHGRPDNLFLGLYPSQPEAEVEEILAGIPEETIVCGHTHRPMARRVGNRHIFNPGSIGLSYSGDPRAHYLVLDRVRDAWQPTFRQVEYDRSLVQRAFRDSGLLDAVGAIGGLYLRTIQDGHPWASDFGQWLKHQAPSLQRDRERAVRHYLDEHGPGRWSFPYG